MAELDCAPPGTELVTLEENSAGVQFQSHDVTDECDFVKDLLSLEVNLDDGTRAKVFSRKGFNNNGQYVYNCNICKVSKLAESTLTMHMNGRKHQNKLQLPVINAKMFYAQNKKSPENRAAEMCLAPGEPVPPGFEGEIKGVAEVQVMLDANKNPLIGLEYLVELIGGEHKEPYYVCTLCDKKGDPRTVMAHLISYNHRLWYLQLHYPSVYEALGPLKNNKEYKKVVSVVVQNVVEAIENKFGRLTPFVVDKDVFDKDKDKYYEDARKDKHFSEDDGPDFVHLVSEKIFEDIKAQQAAESQAIQDNSTSKRSNPFPDPSSEKKLCVDNLIDDKKDYEDISSISSSSLSGSKSRSRSRSKNKSRSRSRSKTRTTRYYRGRGRAHGRDFDNDYNRRYVPQRRSRSRSYSPGRYRGRYHRRSRSRSRSRSSSMNMRTVHKPYERDLYRKPRRLWETSVGRSSTSGFEKVERKLHGVGPSFANKSQADSKRQIAPTPKELMQQASQLSNERYNLEKYRFAVEIMENEMDKILKGHEKCPEKHPLYPEEWKKFWNRRYKELQAENKDPSKHDFKSEWIKYWTDRMKQLHKEEIDSKRLKLREKYNIKENAEEENVTSLKEQFILKVKPNVIDPTEIIILDDDITSGRQSAASTKSENKRSSRSVKSASPWDDDDDFDAKPRISTKAVPEAGERNKSYDEWAKEYYGPNRTRTTFIRELPSRTEPTKEIVYPALDPSESLNIVSVLRLLTALEDLLGSLGPKVIHMLSTALGMEKAKANSAEDLLLNDANNVMFETVKEKLKGQLFAGMLEPNKVQPVKTAIQKIAALLHQASEKQKIYEEEERKALALKKLEPVSVPGIGTVDKAAIAKQIAAALVAQGKPNVTTDELEQLINAVVGMANASQSANKPLTTAAYLAHMQTSNNSTTAIDSKPALDKILPRETKAICNPVLKQSKAQPTSLVPQYDNLELRNEKYKDPMDGLSDSDLKTLLQNFSNLSTDEQHGLIMYLKKLESKEPGRVENLRKFVNLEVTDPMNENKDQLQHSSGRSSPFSNREGGTNPIADEPEVDRASYKTNPSAVKTEHIVDSDDDDYSYDDVFRAASENVKERQYQSNMKLIQDTILKSSEGARAQLGTDMSVMDATSLIAKLMGTLENKTNESKQMIPETSSSGFYRTENNSLTSSGIDTGNQNSRSYLPSSFGNVQDTNLSRGNNQAPTQDLNIDGYFRSDRVNDALPTINDTYVESRATERYYNTGFGQRYESTSSYNMPSMSGMQYGSAQRYGNSGVSNAEFPSNQQRYDNTGPMNMDQQRFGSNINNQDYIRNVQGQQQRYNQGNQFNKRGNYY